MDHHDGHSGMDMPGMGSMCSMNMLWNHDVENVCVVFTSWHITGAFTMLLSCIAIILISIGYASLNNYIHTYDRRLAVQLDPKSNGSHERSASPGRREVLIPPIPAGYGVVDSQTSRSGTVHLSGPVRATRAALYAGSVGISFWLMLVAMTFNTYLFSSIIIGAFIGHMMYESEVDPGALANAGGKGLACH